MLLVIRLLFIFIYSFLVCFLGIIYCLFSPRNPSHVSKFCRLFGYILNILGIKVELRNNSYIKKYNHAIYIANHQSYYDILAVADIIQPNIVTIGKKSLLYVPFFGILYWLAGNFTVNRKKIKKASHDIKKILKITKKKNFSLDFS